MKKNSNKHQKNINNTPNCKKFVTTRKYVQMLRVKLVCSNTNGMYMYIAYLIVDLKYRKIKTYHIAKLYPRFNNIL